LNLVYVNAARDVEHVIKPAAAEVVRIGDADDQHLIARRREANQRVLRDAAEARRQQVAARIEQSNIGNQVRAGYSRGERFDVDLLAGERLEGEVIGIEGKADLAEEV